MDFGRLIDKKLAEISIEKEEVKRLKEKEAELIKKAKESFIPFKEQFDGLVNELKKRNLYKGYTYSGAGQSASFCFRHVGPPPGIFELEPDGVPDKLIMVYMDHLNSGYLVYKIIYQYTHDCGQILTEMEKKYSIDQFDALFAIITDILVRWASR